jgi:hypothetical protein
MARTGVLLGLLAAGVVACGSPVSGARSGRQPSAPNDIPVRLDVVCHEDGSTELLNNHVRALADGVHIQVDNRAGELVSLNGVRLDFSEGVTEQVAHPAPGEVRIACWPGSMHEGREPERVAIRVHDPDDHWIPGELECSRDRQIAATTLDYFGAAQGTVGDPEEIAREKMKGIADDDIVSTVGYPRAEYREIAVERNDETIALLSFSPAPNGGWLLDSYLACASARLRV